MDRTEQLKKLAEAWESLGERWSKSDCESSHLGKRYDFGVSSVTGRTFDSVYFWERGTDTDDASPCLALLRDVKGEDWTIIDWEVQHPIGDPDVVWQCVRRDGERKAESSKISRIDALTKALEGASDE